MTLMSHKNAYAHPENFNFCAIRVNTFIITDKRKSSIIKSLRREKGEENLWQSQHIVLFSFFIDKCLNAALN